MDNTLRVGFSIAGQEPWHVDDRAYRTAHPDATHRFRTPSPAELEDMQTARQGADVHLTLTLERVSKEPDEWIDLLVFYSEDGSRYRVPVIARNLEGLVGVVERGVAFRREGVDGVQVARLDDEWLEQQRKHIAKVMAGLDTDICARCGKMFTHGDVTVHALVIMHLRCATKKDKARATGVCLFMTKDGDPADPRVVKALKIVKRIARIGF